jgi:nucleoid DNA-binding protein
MNEKITLQDLVELLSEKNDMTKKNADAFLRCMFDLIEEALTNEKYVKIKGLGTFKLTEVDSRESMNVNTGERIEIQGHTKISFTPDTTMKELINKPFSHFETVILNDGV